MGTVEVEIVGDLLVRIGCHAHPAACSAWDGRAVVPKHYSGGPAAAAETAFLV
jgi:hypothetical protein